MWPNEDVWEWFEMGEDEWDILGQMGTHKGG